MDKLYVNSEKQKPMIANVVNLIQTFLSQGLTVAMGAMMSWQILSPFPRETQPMQGPCTINDGPCIRSNTRSSINSAVEIVKKWKIQISWYHATQNVCPGVVDGWSTQYVAALRLIPNIVFMIHLSHSSITFLSLSYCFLSATWLQCDLKFYGSKNLSSRPFPQPVSGRWAWSWCLPFSRCDDQSGWSLGCASRTNVSKNGFRIEYHNIYSKMRIARITIIYDLYFPLQIATIVLLLPLKPFGFGESPLTRSLCKHGICPRHPNDAWWWDRDGPSLHPGRVEIHSLDA